VGGNVSDMQLYRGVGFVDPPTNHRAFEGTKTRVDSLGNVEINRDGTWQAIFPICGYMGGWDTSGGRQDRTSLAAAGINCNYSWEAEAPDKAAGIMTAPQMNTPDKGSVSGAKSYIANLASTEGEDQILWYYIDNETYDGAYFADLYKAIDEADRAANGGQRRYPLYTLSESFLLSQFYSNEEPPRADINGVYIWENYMSTNVRGVFNFESVDNSAMQKIPMVVGQINPGKSTPAYNIKLRFNAYAMGAIAKGAKAFGIWRDKGSVVPYEERPWWTGQGVAKPFAEFTQDIRDMLPLIRQPHWTEWTADCTNPELFFGTRDYNGAGYMIITNPLDSAQTTQCQIADLGYSITGINDYFTNQAIAGTSNVTTNGFTIQVPAYGYVVIRLAGSLF
jgi:hypothetical protein